MPLCSKCREQAEIEVVGKESKIQLVEWFIDLFTRREGGETKPDRCSRCDNCDRFD